MGRSPIAWGIQSLLRNWAHTQVRPYSLWSRQASVLSLVVPLLPRQVVQHALYRKAEALDHETHDSQDTRAMSSGRRPRSSGLEQSSHHAIALGCTAFRQANRLRAIGAESGHIWNSCPARLLLARLEHTC